MEAAFTSLSVPAAVTDNGFKISISATSITERQIANTLNHSFIFPSSSFIVLKRHGVLALCTLGGVFSFDISLFI
jgi:hypothetical protein